MHLRILQASLVARVGARSAHNDTQKHEQKHANLLQVASGSSYHRSASPADFAFDSGVWRLQCNKRVRWCAPRVSAVPGRTGRAAVEV